MENLDSRDAHSLGAPAERPAPPFQPAATAADPPAGPDPTALKFATAAEREAYWTGVSIGLELAAARTADAHPHLGAGRDLGLARESAGPGLVSARLEKAPAAPERALRHDGWTPEKERIFILTLAESGTVADACRACGMSRDAAYKRRNSAAGRAFALAWEAALLLARPAIADDLMSRVRYGVVDRIYRNGELVAERHRHDNRLAMAVLSRLDRRVEEKAGATAAIRAVAEEFEQFLDLLPAGNSAAEAFLARRLGESQLEPPHAEQWDYPPDGDLTLMARAAHCERHGVGLPSEVEIDDLDPTQMESWNDDQLRRAEGSGLLASLEDEQWPDCALADEADASDGMCKIRKLYLRVKASGWNVFEGS
jgi:hypothetical protein